MNAPTSKWRPLEASVRQELGRPLDIRYWHVMDNGRDSVDLLKRLFDQYEGHLWRTQVVRIGLGAEQLAYRGDDRMQR
jgi:hypothetical protein